MAAAIAAWLPGAKAATRGAADLPLLKSAEEWLKAAGADIRNQRFAPIADQAMAKRLAAQTMTLSEFLRHYRPDWHPPRMDRKALVHGHCHHKAVMGFAAESEVLGNAAREVEILDTGCCGMAGSFGYMRDLYEVSRAIGERRLLPAARALTAGSLLVASGTTCRRQVEDFTGARALHPAELLYSLIEDTP